MTKRDTRTQSHSIIKWSESRITRILRITRIFKSLLSRTFMKFEEFHEELNSLGERQKYTQGDLVFRNLRGWVPTDPR